MPKKKKAGSAAWVDPDDAPELTDEFFDRAEIRQGDRVAAAAVRRYLARSRR